MNLNNMGIEQLNSTVKECTMCNGLNSKTLGTLNAPGYGDTESNIVFIGQSLCGKPCIESQIPFTGGSGKLLDQAFEESNIYKNEIYITNVVKCHPPGNRKSEKQEISNCTPFLQQELNLIKPRVIICLGKDAWDFFNLSITTPCKKEISLNNTKTTIHFIYHPSYIMRQPENIKQNYIDLITSVIKSCNT